MGTVTAHGSMMLRRQLGLRLLALRKGAGKTHEDVEEAGICKRSTLSSIENRRGAPPHPGIVLELTRFFGATPEEADAIYALARGAKTPGWWEEYGTAVPEHLGLYIDLESSASSIAAWEPLVIHGLLQHPDYIRALVASDDRHSTGEIESRVAFRLDRQRKTLGHTKLNIILGESAVRMRVGSDAVSATQRQHLLDLAADPDVRISVITAAAGPHAAMRGGFHLLGFSEPLDSPIVYIESQVSAAYLEQPEEIAECRRALGLLQERSIPIEEYSE